MAIDYKLYISDNLGKILEPFVVDGVTWTTKRKDEPGKLTFKIMYDKDLKIQNGNAVRFQKGSKKFFYGFIFSMKPNIKDETVEITAYDQLRYLKNKDTYVYKNWTANQLITVIAQDYQLRVGKLSDTSYPIPTACEDNTSLMDMIQNALDETLTATKKMFILYDDFGKIRLSSLKELKTDLIIDSETGQSVDISSSIDSDVYNQIKLIRTDEESGVREIYMTKDSSNINKWGVLQYCESIDENTNGKVKADALLKLYNQEVKKLKISGCTGDVRIRGGSSVIVQLTVMNYKIYNYMIVESVTHNFKNNEHTMDLTLIGGGYSA